MPDVKWIKLATGLVADAKIRHIRRQKNGDSMALAWVLLLCKAGEINDGGLVYLSRDIPYETADLANEIQINAKVLDTALGLFQRLEMIWRSSDGMIQIVNWEKNQNAAGLDKIREQTRVRVQKHRGMKRDADVTYGDSSRGCVTLRNVTKQADVTLRNATEEELEKERDKERDKETDNTAAAYAHAHEREGADEDRPDFGTIEAYAANNLACLLPGDKEELAAFIGDFPEDMIRYAIDKACRSRKRTWAYTSGILRNWLKSGIRTLGDAKAEADRHKAALQYGGRNTAANQALNYEQRSHEECNYQSKYIDLLAE